MVTAVSLAGSDGRRARAAARGIVGAAGWVGPRRVVQGGQGL